LELSESQPEMSQDNITEYVESAPVIDVQFLLLSGFSLISFSSSIEPMRMANKVLGRQIFQFSCCSSDGRDVQASNGLSVRIDTCIDEVNKTDLLIICSSDGVEEIVLPAYARQAIRKLVHGGALAAGVCTGAYVLAELGLLRDRQCTIHWEYSDIFREAFPHVQLENSLFHRDGRIYTCAGGTAAFDMTMQIIESRCGPEIGGAVLDIAINNQLRPSSQYQRSELRVRSRFSNPTLIKCIEIMENNIENPIEPNELGPMVGMSRRNVERVFRKYAGVSPQLFYRKLRLESARRLVEHTEIPVFEIALATGFLNSSHFTKCYEKQYGTTPTAHRKRRNQKNPEPAIPD
jgi:transcriptional regulator GlxA family with amidase domain